MLRQEWPRLLFSYAIAAVIGWWVFRVTNSHLLMAILVGSVTVDFVVRAYLWRSKPNRFTRFLRTDTMPQETTYSEIWKQVALSALFYLLIAVGGALLLRTVFESPVVPILMAVMILLIFVPERYRSLRRYYRPVEVRIGVTSQQQLVFDADMKSIYGSKLISVLYGGSVTIISISLGIWLIAKGG